MAIKEMVDQKVKVSSKETLQALEISNKMVHELLKKQALAQDDLQKKHEELSKKHQVLLTNQIKQRSVLERARVKVIQQLGRKAEDEEESVLTSIVNLALPALDAVLSDPIMSLIDTGCVGEVSSVQLAALGPNTSIFNFIFQLFTFLGSATCNLLAGISTRASSAETQKTQQH